MKLNEQQILAISNWFTTVLLPPITNKDYERYTDAFFQQKLSRYLNEYEFNLNTELVIEVKKGTFTGTEAFAQLFNQVFRADTV